MQDESAIGEDLWVFGYASLLWKPGFSFVSRERARLPGYRRSFCMWSIHHRGTPEAPGLVLALDPDPAATTEGMAFRVARSEREAVLAYLRERELISSAYREVTERVELGEGAVEAVVYVMDPTHVQYCGGLPLDRQAEVIAHATGGMGPNVEYLNATAAQLRDLDCADPELDDLCQRVAAILAHP